VRHQIFGDPLTAVIGLAPVLGKQVRGRIQRVADYRPNHGFEF